MDFSLVAETFQNMEKTSSRIILTNHLVSLLKNTPANRIKKMIYLIQGKLYPDYEGIELGLAEKLTIRAIADSIGISITEVEKVYSKLGDLGDAIAEISKTKYQQTLFTEKITVDRVYDTFEKIAKTIGSGSQYTKLKLVTSLLNDATPLESKYIIKFLLGNLRLGIADFTVMDALSLTFTGDKSKRKLIEARYNICGDLGAIAEILSIKGMNGLDEIKITPLKPIRPMLATRVSGPEEVLERTNNRVSAELKLDGERVQIHKENSKVELYSRSLEKITKNYPDIVKAVSNIRIDNFILEGEIVPVNIDNNIQPFQELMHRKRKYNIDEIVKKYPIKIYLFDILFMNNRDLTTFDYTKRREALAKILEKNNNKLIDLVKQRTVTKLSHIKSFFSVATSNSCEGLMFKQLKSSYRAGSREYLWMKLKKEYNHSLGDSFDLTVIGAILGKGRRTGYYGALLLATYNRETNTFQSTCKVGTGFSDKNLKFLYEELKKYIIKEKDSRVVSKMKMDIWFKPVIVLEIIASEITLSPIHTTASNLIKENFGLALRFPKFSGRVRFDKNAEDSTTSDELINLYKMHIKTRDS